MAEADDAWSEIPQYGHGVLPGWEPYEGEDRPLDDGGVWLDSGRLCEWVRERSPKVMLGFSTGKDSIAAWFRLREYWSADDIYPYFLYLAPRMPMIERSLTYYEDVLGTDIWRMPNRSVYRFLNDAVAQTPANLPVIIGAQLPDMSYPDIYDWLAVDMGIADEHPWVAHGVRSADSPMRRMLLKKHGPWRPNERAFYPIHDYYVADIRRVLTETGVKLPVDYRLFGRSFDGLDHRFAAPLRENFPEDFEALRALYPLMILDSWRRGDGPDPHDFQ
jgi:hypothetical protein